MKLRDIAIEAWRNVVTAKRRSLTLIGVLIVFTTAFGLMDMSFVNQTLEASNTFRFSGASIETVKLDDSVDGKSCEALAELSGITKSGGIRARATGIEALAMPGSTIPAFEISPGFERVIGAGFKNSGILVSQLVADRLNIRKGDSIQTTDGDAIVKDIYQWPETDGRRPELSYAVLVPVTSDARFDECWAEAWPQSDQLAPLLLSTAIPASLADSPKLSQVNTSLGTRFEGAKYFSERITVFAPILAGLLSFVVLGASVVQRRLEFSGLRHFGVTRIDIQLCMLIDMAMLILVSSTVTMGVFLIWGGTAPTRILEILPQGIKAIFATVTFGLLASTLTYAFTKSRSYYQSFMQRS